MSNIGPGAVIYANQVLIYKGKYDVFLKFIQQIPDGEPQTIAEIVMHPDHAQELAQKMLEMGQLKKEKVDSQCLN